MKIHKTKFIQLRDVFEEEAFREEIKRLIWLKIGVLGYIKKRKNIRRC